MDVTNARAVALTSQIDSYRGALLRDLIVRVGLRNDSL
jgi:hypothetical protein